MATVVSRTANSAHGSIDLEVEDAFGNRSHHSIHLGSDKPCPECGRNRLHEGVEEIDAAEIQILEMVDAAEYRKIEGFAKKGFDMSAARAKRAEHRKLISAEYSIDLPSS